MWSNMLVKFASTKVKPSDIGVPDVKLDGNAVASILNTVYLWTGIIAVIVIIIAGFYFVTSRGDAQQIQRAKMAVLGAVIGLVVIMLAFVITQFVIRGVNQGV